MKTNPIDDMQNVSYLINFFKFLYSNGFRMFFLQLNKSEFLLLNPLLAKKTPFGLCQNGIKKVIKNFTLQFKQ
jgi:hypothetical protein